MPLIPISKRARRQPMRTAFGQTSQLVPIPAPIGGLNFKDTIIAMPVVDAVSLTNVLCRSTGVELRAGWREHVVGLIDANLVTKVSTLMPYIAQHDATQNKLFAAVGKNIFNVTIAVDTPAATQITAATDGVWSHTMFSNTAGGVFLCAVNNGGGYWTYDESGGWIKRVITNGTIPNVEQITSIGAAHDRLWFTFRGSSAVYYLALGAISGALNQFDLGPKLVHGGQPIATTSWTQDGGLNVSDFTVFFGSQGDVIVYEGYDPASAATWSLVGVWFIGRVPAGDKFFTKVGADIYFLTERGVFPLSLLVSGSLAGASFSPITSKIQNGLIPEVVGQIGERWELQVLPKIDALMIQQPRTVNGANRQWMMSLTTNAWSIFSGIEMTATTLFAGTFYFGQPGGVVGVGLESGYQTDKQTFNGTAGTVIEGDIQPAFNPFNTSGQLKTFQMARVIFIGPMAPSVAVRMNTQFNLEAVPGSPGFVAPSGSQWNASNWNEAFWNGSSSTFEVWTGITGVGYYGSLRMAVRGAPGTAWSAAHILYEPGGMM